MTKEQEFYCDDGNCELLIEATSAEEAAREYVSTFEPTETTYWVSVHVWTADEETDEHIKVEVEPHEPRCKGGHEHGWEYEGARGSGGGVVVREVCGHCGQVRLTNTWAHDPVDGEQGLRQVSFSGQGEAA